MTSMIEYAIGFILALACAFSPVFCMPLLEYFFPLPMHYILLASLIVFIAIYLLTLKKDWLSWVIYGGILFQMYFVSLHFTARLNNIVITKDFLFQALNYTLLLLWLAHFFNNGAFKFAATPMNIPVFVFFWACIFGAYWSPTIFWYYSVEWASRYGASVILFYLVVNFVTTRSRWNWALYMMLFMMVATSIYGIMQVHGYDFMSWGRVVNVSTFGNKDFFASFLTYTAPIALFMAFGARNWFDGIVYFLLSLTGLYNIWTGETRGAWVGLMALAAAWFLFECKFGRLKVWLGDWKKQAMIWGTAIVIGLAAAPWVMSEHRMETVKSIFQFETGTNLIRVYMWWTAGRMIWDQPMLGQGLGASHVTYPFFRPDRYHRIGMSHNTDYVHSEELQFLSEQGILGFSTWLAMLIVFFYICYKKIKTIDDITERYLLFGLAGSFLAGVVHDSMNVNLRWTSSMIVFWYVLGLGTRYCLGFEEPESKKQVLREARRRIVSAVPSDPRTYVLGLIVCAGFLFMMYGQYRVIRGDWSLKATEEAGGRTAIDKGADTLRHNPYSHSAYYKVAFHYLNENEIRNALDMYNGLLQIAPNYAQTHQNTGLIYYKLFGNYNARKYVHQSVLEFEWATTLENNFENHTKLLQLYSHVLNDSSRGRYHNQFILWDALEDSFFAISRYWRSVAAAQKALDEKNAGPLAVKDRQAMWEEWVKGINDYSREYWLYRTDTVRRVGRPRNEVRYAMKMSVRYVTDNTNLMQFAVGTLLAPSPEQDEDLLYLVNMVENLEPHQAPPEMLLQVRQSLMQRAGTQSPPPLLAYALGVLSYKVGDVGNARAYFQIAQNANQYRFIRDGIRKYKI